MNFFLVVVAAILAVASAQFGQQYGGFQGQFGAVGYNQMPLQRDARADTGPVLFPQAPADSGMTSGVVVGASGFGFVPPNQPGARARAVPFY